MNTNQTYKRNDNIYQPVELVNISEKSGLATRPGLDNFIVVDGEVVHVASNNYGFVPNERFYAKIEAALDEAGIKYSLRAINNRNRTFAVDYILEDESFHVDINAKHANPSKAKDIFKPMVRAINSYDGTQKTSGSFAIFRQVCSNGLHATQMNIDFKVAHRFDAMDVVMPKIDVLIQNFINNEYYSIHKKFEVLAESPIPDVNEFVKYVLGKTGLVKYEKSEKNPDEPSKAAQLIIDTINTEANQLGTGANLWLGYNAFNEYIHTANDKLFTVKQETDKYMFDAIMNMAN